MPHPQKMTRRSSAFMQSRVEALEPRMLLAVDLKFAVIGDFSSDVQTQPEKDVSTLVHGWNPAFIATVGDNNYPNGAASTIDANVGQYYHDYISPYKGTYGVGSTSGNRFWPTLGNHDWNTGTSAPYTNYFTLPGNGRYYTLTQGNVELFMVDADPHEPDGDTATSVQGQWLHAQMSASTAQWKLVLFHQPAYSSGAQGDNTWMQWPFAQWGASAVLAGHDHDYERLFENGIPYFVDGLAGESITGFNSPISGSQVRYSSDYGAMLLDATSTSLDFQFISRTGQVIDNYTLGAPAVPSAPTALTAVPVSSSQINLSWSTSSTSNPAGYYVERSTNGATFAQIAALGPGATTYNDTGLAQTTPYTYRVRAFNSAGTSPYSPIATATTLSASAFTYISDLPWVSATTGYGTIGKDISINGNPLRLRGVQYSKGIGTHAVSQIVYNLAGKYSTFISDVGVDDEVTSPGSVDFKVTGDGKVLFDTGVLTSSSPTVSLNINVTGVQQLTLLATNGVAGTINYDHADWAGAKLIPVSTVPTAPTPPTGLSASAPAPAQVMLSWTDSAAGNETGFIVQRGTDGINFTQIGTTATGVITYSDTASLVVGTKYYYRVAATNSAGSSGYSNIASATIPATTSATTYLSDLSWVSATTGWGSVQKDKSVGGNTLTLRGMTYAKGIGTHALSQIVYNLNGQYASLASDVGVDDEENSKGTGQVDFKVIGDGVTLFDSGVLTKANPIVHISVSVAGVKQLTLLATNGVAGNIDYDHADWAGAQLSSQTSTPTPPTAPSGLTALAASTTQINLTWSNTAVAQTAIQIDRSSDDVSFTTLPASVAGTATSYSDTNLTAGTTYYYRIRAVNSLGTSPNSAEAHATTTAIPSTPPTAPTGLAAVAASNTQITLTWTNTFASQTAIQIDRSSDDVTFTTLAASVLGTATTYTDTNLTAGTTYYYRIRATNSIGASPNSAEAHAATTNTTVVPAYLSDLTPTSATTGYGTIQKDKSEGGNTITLRGQTYAKGIGTHAVSQIAFALNAQYSTFTADVGVDDEENLKGVGSVDFKVIGDNGVVLFDSGVLTSASPIVHIHISIVGVKNLTLLATNGVANSIDYDHADWAGALVS